MASISICDEQRLVIPGVCWESYEKFLEALGAHRLRHSYDGWNLEMMSPGESHERIKKRIGRLIEILALELRVPLYAVGSWTLRTKTAGKGLEPDESFYVGDLSRLSAGDAHDLNRDPPPDLAVEVEVSRTSVNRQKIYARLGIKELWRYRKGCLSFHALRDGKYLSLEKSLAFPCLTAADLSPFSSATNVIDDTAWTLFFSDWVRQQVWYRKPSA